MIFEDKVNERISWLVKKALDDNTKYKWEVIIEQRYNELWLMPRIKRDDNYPWKTGCLWFNNNRELVTQIINKWTNMVWAAPASPYGFNWTLIQGCLHWSSTDGIPNGDGTTITGRMETEVDEFLVFQDGEFQETVGFVDGIRDDSVDLSSYYEDDWEFCEEPIA